MQAGLLPESYRIKCDAVIEIRQLSKAVGHARKAVFPKRFQGIAVIGMRRRHEDIRDNRMIRQHLFADFNHLALFFIRNTREFGLVIERKHAAALRRVHMVQAVHGDFPAELVAQGEDIRPEIRARFPAGKAFVLRQRHNADQRLDIIPVHQFLESVKFHPVHVGRDIV